MNLTYVLQAAVIRILRLSYSALVEGNIITKRLEASLTCLRSVHVNLDTDKM
jgi:hypothetical protein